MVIGDVPPFPALSGTEELPQVVKNRIAVVAWEKAESENEFLRMCALHVRGDIDLLADRPVETDATPRIRAMQAMQEVEQTIAAGPPPPAGPAVALDPPERVLPRRPAAPEPGREE